MLLEKVYTQSKESDKILSNVRLNLSLHGKGKLPFNWGTHLGMI